MIWIILIVAVYLILVSAQLLFWISFLYARYAKATEMERQFINLVTKTAANIVNKRSQHMKSKDKDNDNTGYA